MSPAEGELPRDWHPILDQLHAALVAKMEREGISGLSVATTTGVAQPNVSQFLKKRRGLAWNSASAIADYLGMSLELNPKPAKPRKRGN